MALSITATLGKLFSSIEKLTPAKLNQLVGSLTFAITGTVDNSDLSNGAVTHEKSTPGPYWYAVDGGTANAKSITPSPALTSLEDGAMVIFRVTDANTGATTLDVNTLGAKSILHPDGEDLTAGNLAAGTTVICVYNSSQGAWILVSEPSNPRFLNAAATLDFGSTASNNSADLTVSVPGAALGDPVALGVPNGSVNADTSFSAFVSAADTVTVRFNNYSTGAVDPASGSFNVIVFKL